MWLFSRDNLDKQDVAEVGGGVVLGVVLTAAVSWLVLTPGSDSGGDVQRAHLSAQLPTNDPSAQPRAAEDQRQRCTDAATSTQVPLHRAAASIAQWQVHVDVMNQLVTGVLSAHQATAFWNRTRVGARQRVASFERTRTRLLEHGLDCPSPAQLPSGSSGPVRACARRAAADMRVLDAAAIAIHTWRRHVRAMDMLRTGKISPSTAGHMWLGMWHRGQREIETYRAAVRAARGLPPCPGAGA